MLAIIVVILTAVSVAPAAVKRDEYGGLNGSSSSSSSSSNNNQPVYSPSSSSASYSNAGSSGYNSNGYSSRDNYANSNQFAADHNAAASSSSASYQSQPASQGNLYYYYYPVQEKPKDSSAYHASSSNQYSNAVSPPFGNGGANGQISGDIAQHSGLDTSASGQDLSYSAQDLSYSAQNLGSDYSPQSGASYDQHISNLANQLQQYGFGTASGNGAFGPSTFASGSQGSHPSYSAAASSFGSQNGGQLPFNAQTGYSPYGGQHAYGNYAAASSPQATYEPPSSGYRRYGLSSILMPMLALAGLSLLIPTVTSLGSSGRRKRSAEESAKESAFPGFIDRLERYYSIYKKVMASEDH